MGLTPFGGAVSPLPDSHGLVQTGGGSDLPQARGEDHAGHGVLGGVQGRRQPSEALGQRSGRVPLRLTLGVCPALLGFWLEAVP